MGKQGEVTVAAETGVTVFDPQEARRAQAKLDAIIKYAKTMHDWPTLERAIDEKIEQQREFVRWWDENVGVNHGGRRKGAGRKSSRKD